MLIRSLILVLLFILSNISSNYAQALYSPVSNLLLKFYESNERNTELLNKTVEEHNLFVIQKKDELYFTIALIKTLNPNSLSRSFEELGIILQNEYEKNYWTAFVPLRSLKALGNLQGVEYIAVDEKQNMTLNNGILDTKADKTYSGENLSKPYKGTGAIIGIVDKGFDFTHPIYRKENSTAIRIKSVWNQNKSDESPPASFSYGSEYYNPELIAEKEKDVDHFSHGSHVSGIAAGAGVNNNTYHGVAPDADLVLVSTTFGDKSILDGVKYIFKYADEKNLPAVVNLSIGGRFGPKDGLSDFDRSLETLVKRGRIVVGAAGNSGDKKHHISHTFESQESIQTIAYLEPSGDNSGETAVDFWGHPNVDFNIKLMVVDTFNKLLWQLPKVFEGKDNISSTDTFFLGQDFIVVNSTRIGYNHPQSPNDRSRIFVYLQSSNRHLHHFIIECTSPNGTVHGWSLLQNLGNEVKGFGIIENCIEGDTTYSINEIGGTCKKIITAGAHTTTIKFTNILGEEKDIYKPAPIGEIAPFSSTGPTLDGRTKPDITAPGNMINSAISSFDTEYGDGMKGYEYVIGNKTWQYAYQHGTSMSAPFVTGAVALMLEYYPQLSYEEAHEFLTKYARKDNFTGTIPLEGEVTWGWGKLDIWRSLDELIKSPVSTNKEVNLANDLRIYPNPTNDFVHITNVNETNSSLHINIYELSGKLISEIKYLSDQNTIKIPVHQFPAGLYLLKIEDINGNQHTSKLLIRN